MVTLSVLLFAGCADGVGQADTAEPTCQAPVSAVRYLVTDADQQDCYDSAGSLMDCPAAGERFHGQDAGYQTLAPSYSTHCGGELIQDERTGLEWEAAHHPERVDYAAAESWCEGLELGGHDDWRVPSIKELFSIGEWNGDQSVQDAFYLDGSVFDLAYPELDEDTLTGTHQNQMMGQTWSSTPRPDEENLRSETHYFFNFLDGHIKSNSAESAEATLFYRCVRGDELENEWVADEDGTVTDGASGLIWQRSNAVLADGSLQMPWEDALAWCEELELAGRSDWRLPDVKELQSIVDYAPADWSTQKKVLDTSVFEFELPAGRDLDTAPTTSPPDGSSVAPFFWSSTTHGDAKAFASYVCFGPCWAVEDQGFQHDVHGPGAQRSDPKDDRDGQLWQDTESIGDQLDVVQVDNFVRCVSGGV